MKRVFIWITALPLLLLSGGVDLPALAAFDPVGHSWSDWTIDIAPNCTEAGSKSRHCIYCQAKDAPMSIPALGHAFGAWTLDQSPDCSNSGAQHRSCSRCGVTESERLQALGHSFGAWKVEQANPCMEEGQALRTCSTCQTQEVRGIPAAGHGWSPWTELRKVSRIEAGEQERSYSICAQRAGAPRSGSGPCIRQLERKGTLLHGGRLPPTDLLFLWRGGARRSFCFGPSIRCGLDGGCPRHL